MYWQTQTFLVDSKLIQISMERNLTSAVKITLYTSVSDPVIPFLCVK